MGTEDLGDTEKAIVREMCNVSKLYSCVSLSVSVYVHVVRSLHNVAGDTSKKEREGNVCVKVIRHV